MKKHAMKEIVGKNTHWVNAFRVPSTGPGFYRKNPGKREGRFIVFVVKSKTYVGELGHVDNPMDAHRMYEPEADDVMKALLPRKTVLMKVVR
jgi:hypothetical protein